MHYSTEKNNHGLPHDPFKAIVSPRPIGWIGTKSKDGILNLAPYSFFNAISDKPYYVTFSSSNYKDSLKNIEDTGEFTTSVVSEKLFEHMNNSSVTADPKINEFELTNLNVSYGRYVKAPYVSEAPAALECKLWKVIDLPNCDREKGTGNYLIIGKVLGIYINDNFIIDGLLDINSIRPIVRLGYMDYGVVGKENLFTKNRPVLDENGMLKEIKSWDGKYK